MKVSASIVTYNSEKDISTVLDSLLRSQSNNNIEVLVVDNDSKDHTTSIVEELYPSIKLIKSPKNLGFGSGHNLALKHIDSDYHIFVNPDIIIEPGEIDKMIYFMETNKEVVILSPRVLNTDGTEQFLPKKFPNIKYLLGGRFESISKVFYKWRSEYTLRDSYISTPIHIDFCTGCFMFCRTDALLKVGGFDERYFLHFEDADLTRKMQKIGETMFVPHVHVTHKWKRENKGSGKIFFIALLSMLKYLRKWRKA